MNAGMFAMPFTKAQNNQKYDIPYGPKKKNLIVPLK